MHGYTGPSGWLRARGQNSLACVQKAIANISLKQARSWLAIIRPCAPCRHSCHCYKTKVIYQPETSRCISNHGQDDIDNSALQILLSALSTAMLLSGPNGTSMDIFSNSLSLPLRVRERGLTILILFQVFCSTSSELRRQVLLKLVQRQCAADVHHGGAGHGVVRVHGLCWLTAMQRAGYLGSASSQSETDPHTLRRRASACSPEASLGL